MNHTKNRAFTLIELLVVISIIGLLSSIVLASLSNARESAREASIAATLSNIRTQAELYHGQNGGTYTGLCQDGRVQRMLGSLSSTGDGADCFVSTDKWSAGSYKGEQLARVDYGVVVSYDNETFQSASPLGVGIFDDTSHGSRTWSNAKSYCSNNGKRMPSPSAMMAIREILGTYPSYYSSAGVWSAVTVPSDSSSAYNVNFGQDQIYSPPKSGSQDTVCVE